MNDPDRWRLLAPLVLSALLVASMLGPVRANAQTVEDLTDLDAGDYTVGLYADPDGTSREVALDSDADSFTAYIGLTGDPMKVFSGVAFRIELPDFLEPAGPIRWTPIQGLTEKERVLGEIGGQVVFTNCALQSGPKPFVLGRLELRVDPRFRTGTVAVLPHARHGLQVQLCGPNETWPKRNADPRALEVTRRTSLWDRITAWFD